MAGRDDDPILDSPVSSFGGRGGAGARKEARVTRARSARMRSAEQDDGDEGSDAEGRGEPKEEWELERQALLEANALLERRLNDLELQAHSSSRSRGAQFGGGGLPSQFRGAQLGGGSLQMPTPAERVHPFRWCDVGSRIFDAGHKSVNLSTGYPTQASEAHDQIAESIIVGECNRLDHSHLYRNKNVFDAVVTEYTFVTVNADEVGGYLRQAQQALTVRRNVTEALAVAIKAFQKQTGLQLHRPEETLLHGIVLGLESDQIQLVPGALDLVSRPRVSGRSPEQMASAVVQGLRTTLDAGRKSSPFDHEEMAEMQRGLLEWGRLIGESGMASSVLRHVCDLWKFSHYVSQFLEAAATRTLGNLTSNVDSKLHQLGVAPVLPVLGLRLTYLDVAILSVGGRFRTTHHPLRFRFVLHDLLQRFGTAEGVVTRSNMCGIALTLDVSFLYGATYSQMVDGIETVLGIIRQDFDVTVDELSDETIMALIVRQLVETRGSLTHWTSSIREALAEQIQFIASLRDHGNESIGPLLRLGHRGSAAAGEDSGDCLTKHAVLAALELHQANLQSDRDGVDQSNVKNLAFFGTTTRELATSVGVTTSKRIKQDDDSGKSRGRNEVRDRSPKSESSANAWDGMAMVTGWDLRQQGRVFSADAIRYASKQLHALITNQDDPEMAKAWRDQVQRVPLVKAPAGRGKSDEVIKNVYVLVGVVDDKYFRAGLRWFKARNVSWQACGPVLRTVARQAGIKIEMPARPAHVNMAAAAASSSPEDNLRGEFVKLAGVTVALARTIQPALHAVSKTGHDPDLVNVVKPAEPERERQRVGRRDQTSEETKAEVPSGKHKTFRDHRPQAAMESTAEETVEDEPINVRALQGQWLQGSRDPRIPYVFQTIANEISTEGADVDKMVDQIVDKILEHIDLDNVLGLTTSSPEDKWETPKRSNSWSWIRRHPQRRPPTLSDSKLTQRGPSELPPRATRRQKASPPPKHRRRHSRRTRRTPPGHERHYSVQQLEHLIEQTSKQHHDIKRCKARERRGHESVGETLDQSGLLISPIMKKQFMMVDTGASVHVFRDVDEFVDAEPCQTAVSGVHGMTRSSLRGSANIMLGSGNAARRVKLNSVLHMPDCGMNVLSVSQLDRQGIVLVMKPRPHLLFPDGHAVEVIRADGVYVVRYRSMQGDPSAIDIDNPNEDSSLSCRADTGSRTQPDQAQVWTSLAVTTTTPRPPSC